MHFIKKNGRIIPIQDNPNPGATRKRPVKSLTDRQRTHETSLRSGVADAVVRYKNGAILGAGFGAEVGLFSSSVLEVLLPHAAEDYSSRAEMLKQMGARIFKHTIDMAAVGSSAGGVANAAFGRQNQKEIQMDTTSGIALGAAALGTVHMGMNQLGGPSAVKATVNKAAKYAQAGAKSTGRKYRIWRYGGHLKVVKE